MGGAIPEENLSKALNYIRSVNQEREGVKVLGRELLARPGFLLTAASLLFMSAKKGSRRPRASFPCSATVFF